MSQPGGGRGRGRAGFRKEPRIEASSSRNQPGPSGDASQSHGVARAHKIPLPVAEQTMRHARGIDEEVKKLKIGIDSKISATSKKGDTGGSGDGNGNGNGGLGQSIGRGGVRGRGCGVVEILKTKPSSLMSKMGSTGNQVTLVSNYFKLTDKPRWIIYQYRVDFNCEELTERDKRKCLREHVERVGRSYIFDGSMLFSARRLTQDNQTLSLTSVRETDQFPIQIEIRLVQELASGNIVYLQVFNILVRRSLGLLNLQLVNRDYFDASASIRVPKFNLEIWPGYVTAIKQHEKDILMCSEISHKVVRTDTAYNLLDECTKQGRDYRHVFQQAIIGEIVLTDYNNKTYRIDDVDFSVNPMSKFKLKNGEEVTFVDYYRSRYNIKIRDPNQPMLVSLASARAIRAGSSELCMLVPELCRMTGLSSRMRENNVLMRTLSDFTRVNPSDRIKRLMRFNERLFTKPEIVQEFRNWDLNLSKDLVNVPARELPREKILHANGFYNSGPSADWTKDLRSNAMLFNATIKNWSVIYPSNLHSEVTNFLDLLKKAASGMRFILPKPTLYGTKTDRPSELMEAVENVIGRSHQDLLMFICTNDRADRYNAIKKKCYVDRGIPSQVALIRKITSKGAMSIATKIAVQINCKVGGAPWSVENPMQSVMVVGYDACHDSNSKGKSYGAMVASLNRALSAWFSAVSHHSSGEELSDSLSIDICKALRKYREVSGDLPARIFVYRDGVGDGQISYVYKHEVEILKQRLTELYGGDRWKLCYIIVTKRINTRLFKRGENPAPGTVVDDVITLPERYDFYLISQCVNSGTVTPTSYNVISDNVGLSPDQIQRFTYKMTHLYYNWSGTVRVPAPCQYAHKLAFLVSQSLHAQPHPNLDSSLYFL